MKAYSIIRGIQCQVFPTPSGSFFLVLGKLYCLSLWLILTGTFDFAYSYTQVFNKVIHNFSTKLYTTFQQSTERCLLQLSNFNLEA